jgi:aerobic C4-dicarboxylate transport protein
VRNLGSAAANKEKGGTVEFLLGVIPATLMSALTTGEVLQTLLVALFVGFALQGMGSSGEPILRGIHHVQRLIFRILG